MSCKDDCNRLVTHNFVLGLPEKLTPLTIYFVKTGSATMDMYVTDSKGVAHLIDGQGGGAQIQLNSPNNTIQIDGYNIDVADYIMEIINNIQNGYVVSVNGDLVDNSDPANPIIATPNLLQVLQEGSVAGVEKPVGILSIDSNLGKASSLELEQGEATLFGDIKIDIVSNDVEFVGSDVPYHDGKYFINSINGTTLADSEGNVVLINDDSNYLKLTGETDQSVEGLVNFINATVAASPQDATDIVNKAYVDALIVGLVRLAGDWDASTGTFPTTGTGTGGAIRRGDSYIVNVAGIIAGQVYDIGDTFYSKVNAPGQTATNWGRFEVPAGQATNVLAGIMKLYTTTGTATDGTMTQLATTTAINAKVADTITDGVTTIAPSQNAVFDALILKQNNLISGTNIKTVGGTTLLGSGDIPFPIEVQNSLIPSSATLAPSVDAVTGGLALKAALASPAFTGTPTVPQASTGNVSTIIANTAFVDNAISNAVAIKANIASPTFTGDPKAPTAAPGDNDTSIATTAFVTNAVATGSSAVIAQTITDGVTTSAPSQNAVYDALVLKADDANVVHKTTDETIQDKKTFRGEIIYDNGVVGDYSKTHFNQSSAGSFGHLRISGEPSSTDSAVRIHLEPASENNSGTRSKVDWMYDTFESNPSEYRIFNVYTKNDYGLGTDGITVINNKSVGTMNFGAYPSMHFGFSDDQSDAQPMKIVRFDTTDTVWRTTLQGAWKIGKSVTTGDYVTSDNKLYVATTTGICGTIKPVHTSGTVSDGNVSWTFTRDYTIAANAGLIKPVVLFGDRIDMPKFGFSTTRVQFAKDILTWNNIFNRYLSTTGSQAFGVGVDANNKYRITSSIGVDLELDNVNKRFDVLITTVKQLSVLSSGNIQMGAPATDTGEKLQVNGAIVAKDATSGFNLKLQRGSFGAILANPSGVDGLITYNLAGTTAYNRTFDDGNTIIGSSILTNTGYKLDVQGTFRASGTAIASPATLSTELVTKGQMDTADALKANIASPTFTGTPAAPTATAGTSTTQLATTAFVTTADNLKANIASPTFTGTPVTPTLTFTGNASPAYTQGGLFYDTGNESLTFFNNDSNVGLQIGQEDWIRVRNDSGSTIPNGTAVYISGATGTLPNILPAQANAAATTVAIGLTTEAIPTNSIGYVTCLGVVNGLNTSGFTAGSTVYLSSTVAGGLTTTAPLAPNFRYRMGVVVRSDATLGSIHVTPTTGALGNGTANQVFGMNAAGTSQEVKTIQGTTNQITVTNTANAITISGGWLSGSATLDFPSTNANSSSDLTIAVTGAAIGDVVSLGAPAPAAASLYTAFVSATNTVTVRYINFSVAAINPASATFSVKVFKP